jgi:hypothetical protein
MSDIIMLTVQTIAAACVARPSKRVAGTLLDKCQPSSDFIYFLVPPFFGGRPFLVPYVPDPFGIYNVSCAIKVLGICFLRFVYRPSTHLRLRGISYQIDLRN